MSRTTNARRRIALLASSSFVASSVLAGVGGAALTALSPSVALAGICTTLTDGTYTVPTTTAATTITCGPGPENPGSVGLTYNGAAGSNLLIYGNTNLTGGGVLFNTTTNTANLGVTIIAPITSGFINATPSTNDGIHVSAINGSVSVDLTPAGNTFAVTGGGNGVSATNTGSGTVTVKLGNTVTGNGGAGINASSGSGNVIVTTDAGSSVTGSTNGISASTGSGTSTVTVAGNVSGNSGAGVAASGAGVTFNQTGGSISSTSGHGVSIASGSGTTTLNTSVGTTISGGTSGNGINVSATGGSISGTIAGNVTGDWATSVTQSGTGTINLTYTGSETGTNGGIQQTTASGSNTLLLGTGGSADGGTGGNAGIQVTSSAGGAVNVSSVVGTDIVTDSSTGGPGVDAEANAGGGVTVNLAGTVGNAHAVGGDGVHVVNTGGTVGSSVTTAAVTANGVGINVNDTSTGGATTTANGNITGGTGGIAQTTSGGANTVNLATGIVVTGGTGTGVSASAAGAGDVTVTDGVVGTGTDSGHIESGADGIRAISSGTGTGNVTVNYHGAIGSTAAVGGIGVNTQIQNVNSTAAISVDTGSVNSTNTGIYVHNAGAGSGGGAGVNTGITVNTGGAVTSSLGYGVVAENVNTTNNDNVVVNIGADEATPGTSSVTSFNTGVTAQTFGAGNISVITQHGDNVSSTNGDGIDAFALGGGNVTVRLLDGAINSNTSGGSGPVANGSAGPQSFDPHGINAQTHNGSNTSLGTNYVDIQDNVTNTNGDAVLSNTENGLNYVHLDSNGGAATPFIHNTLGGSGIDAIATGDTPAIQSAGNGADNILNQTGVYVATDAGTDIEATGSGSSNGITASYTGAGGLGQLVVQVFASGTIGASAPVDGNGIDASITNALSGGSMVVESDNSVAAAGIGLHAATAGTGQVTVNYGTNATGTIQINSGNTGILAETSNASNNSLVNVNVGDGGFNTESIVASGGNGIQATSAGSGTVTVADSGASVTASSGTGIVATSAGGPVTVTNNDGFDSITAANSGIVATTTGTGAATAQSFNDGLISATTGRGIDAESGSGTVTVDEWGNISAATDGIYAQTTGAIAIGNIDGAIYGGISGVTGGGNTAGIDAEGGTGTITINYDNWFSGGITTPGAGYGIKAVGTGNGGDITINTFLGIPSGAIDASTAGISATANSNDATAITINNALAINIGGGPNTYGIYANNAGTGGVSVTNSGAIDPAAFGIWAQGGGAVSITNSGAVIAGTGLHALSAGSGTVTVINGAGAAANITATGGSGSTGIGIEASSQGGNVSVTSGESTISAVSGGVKATTTGAASATFDGYANGASVITTTGGKGIDVESGSGTVTVDNWGSINAATDGIYASTTGAINIGTIGGCCGHGGAIWGPITGVTGGGATAGIDAEGGTGLITIVYSNWESSGINTPGAGYGIKAVGTGNGGDISITTYDDNGIAASINAATAGISATANSNDATAITITNHLAINIGGGPATYGIYANNAGKGSVTVNNYGDIDPAAYGIFATGGGTVTVNDIAPSVVGGIGIHGDTFGSTSTVSVTVVSPSALTPATVTGTTGNGIEAFATAGGNVVVDTHLGGTITGATNGISTAVTGGAGTTSIDTWTNHSTVTTPVAVVGQGGDGILATSTSSGAITIKTGNVSGTGAGGAGSGVVARSTGSGSVSVTTWGNVSGDPTGNATTTGSAGISATTTGPLTAKGNVAVTVNGQIDPITSAPVATNVTGANYGIVATSTGVGATTVVINSLGGGGVKATGAGTVNGGAGPVGVWASSSSAGATVGAATSVAVTANANVIATNGRAIVTNAGNNASITIGAGAMAQGLGDATHAVVDMTAVTGATTTLTNNGLITSKNAVPASYADLAVKGTTGAIKEVNNGAIYGRQDFSGLTAASNLDIENAGAWHSVGTSTLGTVANTELVNNTGYIGLANGGVATTVAFGTGTNTLNNAGTIIAGEGMVASAHTSGPNATPAVTTITGTATFNNTGTLILGSASTSAAGATSDRSIDSVVLATHTTFGGTGHVALDANLWSDTQSAAACGGAALTAADCLVVAGSTGNNALVVKDTNAHAFGAFNPTGIVIVAGSSAASTFHLDPTSDYFNAGGGNQFGGATNILNKPGMFFYDLAFDGHNELLFSVPKATAFEFSSLGGAVNDVWYATTQTWFDRQADLRDTLQGRSNGSQPGIWLKGFGDWATRNHTDAIGLFGKTYVFDVSYDQTTGGLIGGIDLLNVTNKNMAWVAGIQGGAVDSNVDFKASPDRYHLSGETIGGYLTYLSGGLYVDGIVNANILKMRANLPGLMGNAPAAPLTPEADVHSVGGQVEAGYEMPLGANAFWEPLGILSYVSEKFGDLAVPGGLAHIDHAESFRGSLGARVGLTQSYQYYKVKLSVTGRVWDEFSSNTNATFTIPGGPGFVSSNDIKGAFGEFSGQANLFSTTSGLSAFVTGGYKFKSNYNEGTVTIGARYQW
jgi:hypothetical protein